MPGKHGTPMRAVGFDRVLFFFGIFCTDREAAAQPASPRFMERSELSAGARPRYKGAVKKLELRKGGEQIVAIQGRSGDYAGG